MRKFLELVEGQGRCWGRRAVPKMHSRMEVQQARFATSFNLFFVTISQISLFLSYHMVKYLLFLMEVNGK